MLEMFVHPASFPFACALMIVALLGVLELVSMMFGAALSCIVDGLLPDFDFDVDVDVDVDGDMDTGQHHCDHQNQHDRPDREV